MSDEPRTPDPVLDPSPASWRAMLIARTWVVMAITAGITLAIVIASFLPAGPRLHVWVGAILYAIVLLATWPSRLRPRVHSILMLAALLLITPILFVAAGLTPAAFLCLTLACVLAAILVDARASISFFVAGLVAIAIGAFWITGQR